MDDEEPVSMYEAKRPNDPITQQLLDAIDDATTIEPSAFSGMWNLRVGRDDNLWLFFQEWDHMIPKKPSRAVLRRVNASIRNFGLYVDAVEPGEVFGNSPTEAMKHNEYGESDTLAFARAGAVVRLLKKGIKEDTVHKLLSGVPARDLIEGY